MSSKTKFLGLFQSKKLTNETPIDSSLVCVYNVSPDESLNQIPIGSVRNESAVNLSTVETPSFPNKALPNSSPSQSSNGTANSDAVSHSFFSTIERDENAIQVRPELNGLPRIVSLNGAISEALVMMGLEECLVGRSHDCSRIPSIQHVPCVSFPAIGAAIQHLSSAAIESIEKERAAQGLSKFNLNELILSESNPDLILIQDVANTFGITLKEFKALCAEYLSGLDHAVRIVVVKPTMVSDVWESIKTIGDLIGQSEAGENVVRRLTEKFSYIRSGDKFRKSGTIPRVICLQWLDPLLVSGYCVPEIVASLGAKPLLAQAGKPPSSTSFETIVKLDPDFMIIMCNGFSIDRTEHEMAVLQGHKEWFKLKCVLSNRVFIVDGLKFFNSLGPSIIDSAKIMQEILFGNSPHFASNEGIAYVRFNGLVKTNLTNRPRPPGKAQVQNLSEDQEAELARHRGSMRNAIRGFKHMFKLDSSQDKSSRSKGKREKKGVGDRKEREREKKGVEEREKGKEGEEKMRWGVITEGVEYEEILRYNEKISKMQSSKKEEGEEDSSRRRRVMDDIYQAERMRNMKKAGFMLLDEGKNGVNGKTYGERIRNLREEEEDQKFNALTIPTDGVDQEPNSAEFGSEENSGNWSERSEKSEKGEKGEGGQNGNGGKDVDCDSVSEEEEEGMGDGKATYFHSRTYIHHSDDEKPNVDFSPSVNLTSEGKMNGGDLAVQDPPHDHHHLDTSLLPKLSSIDSDRDVSECSSETDRDDVAVIESLNMIENTDAVIAKSSSSPSSSFDGHANTLPHKASIIHSKSNSLHASEVDTTPPFGSIVITGKALILRNLIMQVIRDILPCSCILVSGGFSSSIIVECAKYLEKESGHGIGCGIAVLAGSKASDRCHVEKLSDRCDLKIIKPDGGNHHAVKVFDVLKSELPFVVHTLRSFDPLEVRCGLALSYALREAKKHGFDRVIIGDSADELFTGYDFMQNMDARKLFECRSHMFSVMKFPATVLGKELGIEVIQPFLHPSVQKFALELNKEDLLGSIFSSTPSSPTSSFPSPAPSSPSQTQSPASYSLSSPNSSPSFPYSSPLSSPSSPSSSSPPVSLPLSSSTLASIEEGNNNMLNFAEGKLILRHAFPDVYAVNRGKDSVEVGSGMYVLQRRICHKLTASEFKTEKKRIRSEDRVRLRDPEHLHYYRAFRHAFGGPEMDGCERYTSDDACVACGHPPNFPDQLFCAICGEYPARKISPLKISGSAKASPPAAEEEEVKSPAEESPSAEGEETAATAEEMMVVTVNPLANANDDVDGRNRDADVELNNVGEGGMQERRARGVTVCEKEQGMEGDSPAEDSLSSTKDKEREGAVEEGEEEDHKVSILRSMDALMLEMGAGKSKLSIKVSLEAEDGGEEEMTYLDSGFGMESNAVVGMEMGATDDELGLGSEGGSSMVGLLESIDSGLESWSAFLGEDMSLDWSSSFLQEGYVALEEKR